MRTFSEELPTILTREQSSSFQVWQRSVEERLDRLERKVVRLQADAAKERKKNGSNPSSDT